MSGQANLGSFSDGAPEPAKPVYNCWTCLMKLDIVIQEGRQKVKCRGSGLRDFRDVCSSWTNGHDLANFPKVPEGFKAKKWSRA